MQPPRPGIHRSPDNGPEEILWEGHPCWQGMLGFYLKWQTLALVITLIAIFAAQHGAGGASMAASVAILSNGIVLGLGWLYRRLTTYTMSNQRVMTKLFLPRRLTFRREEAHVLSLVDSTVTQTIFQRMLGVGTVDFDTASEQQGDLLRWWGVRDPYGVADRLNRAINFDSDWHSAKPAAPEPESAPDDEDGDDEIPPRF